MVVRRLLRTHITQVYYHQSLIRPYIAAPEMMQEKSVALPKLRTFPTSHLFAAHTTTSTRTRTDVRVRLDHLLARLETSLRMRMF